MKDADVVTWFMVILGWLLVHYFSLARERRKEKRDLRSQLCKSLLELQTAAIDFHTANDFDERKSLDIAQQVERIVCQIQRAPLSELRIMMSPIIELRRRITRHNIDPSDFSKQAANSEIILNIRNAVTDLTVLIEDARERVWK